MIKDQVIILTSINISLNSVTLTKSSDTVYKCFCKVSFRVRPNSFQVSVYGSLKTKESLHCRSKVKHVCLWKNEQIQSLYGSSNRVLLKLLLVELFAQRVHVEGGSTELEVTYGHTFHCLIASLNLSYGPLYAAPAFAVHRESVASVASLKIFCQEMTV